MTDSTSSPLIYKICPSQSWGEALVCGYYRGSTDDLRDGFIHFSTASQLQETLCKHYTTQPDLLLICVNSQNLGAGLKWEPSRGGDLFPHLFADLLVSDAIWTYRLALDESGRHILPVGDFMDYR